MRRRAKTAAAIVVAVAAVLVSGAVTGTDARDSSAGAAGAGTASVGEAEPVLRDVYVIRIEKHTFHPEELVVPSGRKVKLRIENDDATPEEFESYELNREKVVVGGGTITVYIGPLKPGRYPYFGDFNPKTAQGVIIAKPLAAE